MRLLPVRRVDGHVGNSRSRGEPNDCLSDIWAKPNVAREPPTDSGGVASGASRVNLILEDGRPHPKYPYGYATDVREPYQESTRRILRYSKTLFGVSHSIFPRATEGRPVRVGKQRYDRSRANDVKAQNYGWWQGKLVCIDGV